MKCNVGGLIVANRLKHVVYSEKGLRHSGKRCGRKKMFFFFLVWVEPC
jgi:hypothetical protein